MPGSGGEGEWPACPGEGGGRQAGLAAVTQGRAAGGDRVWGEGVGCPARGPGGGGTHHGLVPVAGAGPGDAAGGV